MPTPPFVPVGAGIVGAGVANLLDRMRRVQQRYRREGTFIELPGPDQRDLEQRLRLGEGPTILEDVDRSLQSLRRWWEQERRPPPSIVGVKVRPDVVEVVVDGPVAPCRVPDHVRIAERGRSVLVDRPVALPSSRAGAETGSGPGPRPSGDEAVAPVLVTAGSIDDGVAMVNLESLGTLAVTGSRDMCDGFVRALALELATSRWSGHFDLVVVGFGAELVRFPRVSARGDVEDLTRELCRRHVRGRQRLERSGFDSFYRARCADGPIGWEPLVVLCGPGLGGDETAALVETVADGSTGITVVACGDGIEAAHTVHLADHGPVSLSALDAAILPQRIDADDLRAASALLDIAAQRAPVLSSDEPYVSLPIGLPIPEATRRSESGPVPTEPARPNGSLPPIDVVSRPALPDSLQIEVAVLGPIEIRGAAREFTRAWAKELVVYLAMHPNGASNESWATALWPDRVMAPASLHSTASVARRCLGQTPDGKDHLPRSHGRLALSDSVGTDWDRFVSFAGSSDLATRRAALELIRGRPFDGLRSTDWAILEGIGPAIEAAVVDLSGQVAGTYLTRNRPDEAQWAARKGLLVSPYDERLYRMLMRAADAAGHPAGVEAVMAELVRLVADDIEPMDSIHPATIDLYRSLSRRRRSRPTLR